MSRWSAWAVLVIAAAALALRAPKLDARPFHNDEAVNAVKVSELWQHGRYAYDPDEYHGPTLHYATLPFLWLGGARTPDQLSDATLRLAPVAFGVGLILLLLLFTGGLGHQAVLWAAIFTAISPAMVFYSRYFIHEMLLVFFTALTLGAGWRYAQTHRTRWAVLCGAGVGLMFATKETFVITLAAMGMAAFVSAWWRRCEFPDSVRTSTSAPGRDRCERWVGRLLPGWSISTKDLALAAAAMSIVWLLFFSSFFTNFAGLADSIRTYLPWLKRAGGHSPHIHPWYFYLERLTWFPGVRGRFWSEGLIVSLAIVGAYVSLFVKRTSLHRFLVFYTVFLTAFYSAISYKTPWCMLSFLLGIILLAGVGAGTLVQCARRRVLQGLIIVVLAGFAGQLASQAWRASVDFASDRRNPYVYAQTVPDLLNLVEKVEAIAELAPTGYDTVIKVMAREGDYWPLPWYLRRFKHIGWYDNVPEDARAPILIVSPKHRAVLEAQLKENWSAVGMFGLRPGSGNFFELYVQVDLWAKYLQRATSTSLNR